MLNEIFNGGDYGDYGCGVFGSCCGVFGSCCGVFGSCCGGFGDCGFGDCGFGGCGFGDYGVFEFFDYHLYYLFGTLHGHGGAAYQGGFEIALLAASLLLQMKYAFSYIFIT